MKLERIVYTIREVLKSVGIDSRLDDRFLIDMINRYREVNIQFYFNKFKEVKPEWFQNLGVLVPVNVNSADDPNVQYTSITFGKLTLPQVVTIAKQETVKIRSASKHQRIQEIDRHMLFKMIDVNDEMLKYYTYYFREGNAYYFYPVGVKITVLAILSNPLEGTTYTAAVLPDGSTYSAAGTKRNLLVIDEYPADGEIITALILDILTKEMGVEAKAIPDITVDSADTDNIIKSQI